MTDPDTLAKLFEAALQEPDPEPSTAAPGVKATPVSAVNPPASQAAENSNTENPGPTSPQADTNH